MSNHDLQQFPDAYIIDAFIDNQITILSLHTDKDLVLFKMYNHVKKILSIECEIRDINIPKLLEQARLLHELKLNLQ